jgi:hypothetical protein
MSFHFSKFAHKPIIDDFEDEELEEEGNLANLFVTLYETSRDDLQACLLGNEDATRESDKIILINI